MSWCRSAFSLCGRRESERSEVEADRVEREWQQALVAVKAWIERLSLAGDFVACPFLGSGTTAVASRQLGRRFVGCDVSEAEVATTKARLRAEGSAEGSRRARTRLYA